MPRHLISDDQLRECYAARIKNGPAFDSLDESQISEFRLFVESRGILWNPKWGLTGRISAYDALRNLTLAEEADTEEKEETDEKDETPEEDDDEKSDESGDEAEEDDSGDEEPKEKGSREAPKAAPRKPDREAGIKSQLADLQRQYRSNPEATLAQAKRLLTPTARETIISYAKRKGAPLAPEEVDDLVSETFDTWMNKVLPSMGGFDKPGHNFPAQINSVAKHAVMHSVRNATIRNRIAPTTHLEEPTSSPTEHEGEAQTVADKVAAQRGSSWGGEPGGREWEDPSSEFDRAERGRHGHQLLQKIQAHLEGKPGMEKEAELFKAMMASGSGDSKELANELRWPWQEVQSVKHRLSKYAVNSDDPVMRQAASYLKESVQLFEQYPWLQAIFPGLYIAPTNSDKLVEQFRRFSF